PQHRGFGTVAVDVAVEVDVEIGAAVVDDRWEATTGADRLDLVETLLELAAPDPGQVVEGALHGAQLLAELVDVLGEPSPLRREARERVEDLVGGALEEERV